MFFLFCIMASLPNTHNGQNNTILEIPLDKSLNDIRNEISHMAKQGSKVTIEFDIDEKKDKKGLLCLNQDLKTHGQYLGYPRPYYASLTETEKQDIRFIVTFLANHSLFSLATHKSELQAAGDRIDHIHPLKFLTYVFIDDELLVCIRNIRGNGWVWKDFSGGIKQSLNTESQAENMKIEYVADFAKQVNLDPKWITHLVKNKNWDDFIETLILKIPRKGEYDRYKD